ncbi:MAG: RluA family pseudouridine synthase [Pirellulaceae bacterium]
MAEDQEAIPILYEEAHFMLVNKPAGLFAQAAPGVPSLEGQLAEQIKRRDQHLGTPFVGLPHRLDRATSGIMLIARNQRALAKFGQQFQSRKVRKFYVALVEGELPPGDHLWEDSIRKVTDEPRAEIVSFETPGAKVAQMRIRSLWNGQGRSVVLVELLTGRMHQIRLQAAARGFPVVDDLLYGNSDLCPEQRLASREAPHALHAYSLEFHHPQSAKIISGQAPLPDHWQCYGEDVCRQIEMISQAGLGFVS